MDDYSRFVPAVKFELIPIKNLVSNQEYQRALSQKHINRAAANFDVFQINPVKVSRRDGINYVFNGQHTIEIVALVSGSRETPVWCMVYEDLYYEHEADIFANQQKFVKQLSSYEIFVASIEAGSDKEGIIKNLVESYGMRIGKTRAPGVICSIATLESIYTKYGVAVLDRTLRMVIGTWEGDVNSFGANILSAIAKLIVVYDEKLNEVIFKQKVGALSVQAITRRARDRRPGSLGFAEAMLIAYNFKSKYPLRQNKLYDKHHPYNPNDVGQYDDEEDADEEESEVDDEE